MTSVTRRSRRQPKTSFVVRSRLVWRDTEGVEHTTPFDEAPTEAVEGFRTQVTVELHKMFFEALQTTSLGPISWEFYYALWEREPEQMRALWDRYFERTTES